MHPEDCTKFIKCADLGISQCPGGLRFDYHSQTCNWVCKKKFKEVKVRSQ